MVLVSNEWQNKCEDVPKTTAITASTTASSTTAPTTSLSPATSTASSTTGPSESISGTGTKLNKKNNHKISEFVAADITNSITATASITDKAESESESSTRIINKTLANDNANNEQINKIKDKNSIGILYKNKINNADDINECKNAKVDKLLSTAKQLGKEENLEESVLNYNNSLKRMAENTKESPLKEAKEEEVLQSQNLINNHHTGNNKDLVESNSYQNSNNNTLTTSPITVKPKQNNQQQNLITQQQQQQHQQQVPLSCPLTPQALSSALQSAFDATITANNVNNSVAAAGLQPNFLSQLALTANVAGLQKSTTTSATILTAKQLSQSFNTLDLNNQNKSDSNILEATSSTTVPATYDTNGQAKIVLICEGNSHPFQTRTISLTPNVECMVGRLIAKSKASENNAIFDCKVLSRKHAVIWYTPDGKFWVKDTKSSNGTFINDNKLGDEEAELHFGDIVKFGVDVLENSRKEVHGCIIACVKLFLPDGREAISIDSSANRSQYSGESHISYDELHRLNLYIQETSQREKVLTSKLCNIQNVLDATRKNSSLCWQSMITEDQLLHRIHSLEKKLQFMEKNVPDNILRNEVIKLLDDKNVYQHTAKEALRKVYQERCDAMQMLAKMESAYTLSDNECSLLRDQIMNSKQTLQDVNTRLLRLETEYNEFKEEAARREQETKDHEEQRIKELTEKLTDRELECSNLKKKISELLIKRAELIEDEEHLLEKQAIEKLDAAIADMDLGDDDDSSSSDEIDKVDVKKNENKNSDNKEKEEDKETDNAVDQDNEPKFVINIKKLPTRPSIFGDKFNGIEEKQQQQQDNSKLEEANAFDSSKLKLPPKRVKETTIMKWLKNSDLNKNEGSLDIFKAICNENDDDESEECGNLIDQKIKTKEPDPMKTSETELFHNFTRKLKYVQKNLKKLEAEIENDLKNDTSAIDEVQAALKSENTTDESSDEDDAEDVNEGACAGEEFIITSNGKTCTPSENQVLSIENKKYLLLKSSVDMLRDAYNEIWHSMKEQGETRQNEQQHEDNQKSLPLNIKVKTQFQTYSASPTTVIARKFDNQTESDNTESDSEVESLTVTSFPLNNAQSVKTNKTSKNQLEQQLQDYQSQVEELNEKLQQSELEAHHTMEIMQVECDDVKLKMENLSKTVESLNNEKKALEQAINENQNKTPRSEASSSTTSIEAKSEESECQMGKELELEEDPVLNAINVNVLEREEELIAYKERLEEQQKENIDLRNEIALLKQKSNAETTKELWLRQYLPYGFIVLATIIYFLTTYY